MEALFRTFINVSTVKNLMAVDVLEIICFQVNPFPLSCILQLIISKAVSNLISFGAEFCFVQPCSLD